MTWEADSVGGVIFRSSTDPQLDALALWPMLFPGDTPDSFNRSAANPAAGTMSAGERDGFSIAINASVGRVNINLQNTDNSDGRSYPRIAELATALSFVTKALKIFAGATTPPRAGLVLDLGQTVPANGQVQSLNEAIGGAPFPADSIDIQYQFNVRKPFETVNNLSMNRICTYYTGEAGFLNMETMPQGRMLVPMIPIVGLKVDVNTAPETRIPVGEFQAAIDEIGSETLAITRDPKGHFS